MLMCENLIVQQDGFELKADMSFTPGATTALLGPSGAGKSTLLSALAGFVDLAEGKVLWNGKDLTPLAPGERPISMLFQDNNLFPHLTIAQNVGLARRPTLRLSKPENEMVQAMLEAVGLGGYGTRKPGSLSGGQQSRAALARILLAERPIVLMDEPFSALGPGLRNEMLDLVGATLGPRNCTLIMVTHDPADALRIADEVVFLSDGQTSTSVPVGEFFADQSKAVSDYLGHQS
jgi:thiamine transport system ATP-binding protein